MLDVSFCLIELSFVNGVGEGKLYGSKLIIGSMSWKKGE